MTHLPRCGSTERWLVATSLLAVAACSSDRNPTAPRNPPAFDISDAVHDGGGGLNTDLVVSVVVFTGFEFPFFLAGFDVQRIQITIPAAKVYNAFINRS